jgi:hypothetical protein
VEKNILAREGFDFEYFTHVIQNRGGSRLYFCYDHGYQYLENDLVELLNAQYGTWVV